METINSDSPLGVGMGGLYLLLCAILCHFKKIFQICVYVTSMIKR